MLRCLEFGDCASENDTVITVRLLDLAPAPTKDIKDIMQGQSKQKTPLQVISARHKSQASDAEPASPPVMLPGNLLSNGANSNLYVAGLPPSTSEDTLRQLFNNFGDAPRLSLAQRAEQQARKPRLIQRARLT